MKDKLYSLLKAKLFDHIFSLILACAAPIIFYFLLFNDGSAYPPLVYMLAAQQCQTVMIITRPW